MSQKRWIVELSFKDAWYGAPTDSDWKPDDATAPDWKDKRLALERAYHLGAQYHCFTRVRRTDEKTAPICHWPINRDDLPYETSPSWPHPATACINASPDRRNHKR